MPRSRCERPLTATQPKSQIEFVKRSFPYPLATVLVLMLAAFMLLISSNLMQDSLTAQKLRQMHAQISGYLALHNYTWPSNPTLPGPGGTSPWWCPPGLVGEAVKFQLADSIPSVPNAAYRFPRQPWVRFTGKDGRVHLVFPDGHVEVRR